MKTYPHRDPILGEYHSFRRIQCLLEGQVLVDIAYKTENIWLNNGPLFCMQIECLVIYPAIYKYHYVEPKYIKCVLITI